MAFLDLDLLASVAELFEEASERCDPRARRWDPTLRPDTWTSRSLTASSIHANRSDRETVAAERRARRAELTASLRALRRRYVITPVEPTRTRWRPGRYSPPVTWTDDRERELVRLRLGGRDYRDIADALRCSANVARARFADIYGKLGLPVPRISRPVGPHAQPGG